MKPPSPDDYAPPEPRWRERLFAQVDVAWLVIFRIAFGAIMLWEVWRYFDQDRIRRYYIEPGFHFTYFGFDWVRPWAGEGMYLHFWALGLLSVCILAGFCYRAAAVLFFLAFTQVFLLDQTQYLNHFYLVSLISFLLIFLPAHRSFSVDALLRPGLRSDTAPAWTLWLLRAQIGIPYFFGGIAKINGDWLRGEPMRAWLAERMDFPIIGPYFQQEWVVYGFVFGGLLLDLLVVPALLWKRTRLLAFAAAVSFHLLNARLFAIGIFPWFMLCATLIFFPPDLPRWLWRRLKGLREPVDAAPPAAAPASSVVVVLLAVYLAVQVLLPFRHLLYPGDVNWTEEGHRFSWHMKLRDKQAHAVFLVTRPGDGSTEEIYPQRYLTPRQAVKMSSRPDMILQFAHFLARRLRLQGVPDAEVRAYVIASLNGRQPQLLVDPEVDLAREPRTLGHARWIVPLSQPLSNQAPKQGHRSRDSD